MEASEKILYAGLVGLFLSDITPTVADSFYFSSQQKLKAKLFKGEITPDTYWNKDGFNYYAYNGLYWAVFGSIVYFAKVDVNTKWKLALGLLAGGAVFAVLNKNIAKDKQDLADEVAKRKQLEQQYPACAAIINGTNINKPITNK